MASRGRPPYPDILTPREWEVLALLREGLSNGQIAERLSITERTAKFHVSEILGKLGLGGREEAARWNPAERRPWWVAAVHWPLKWSMVAKVAGVGLAAGTAGGIALLTWGVVATDSPPFDDEPDLVVEQEGDVVSVKSRPDGVCEVLLFNEEGAYVDWRVDPCAELEAGGKSCVLDGRQDSFGNHVSGTHCVRPFDRSLVNLKMRCGPDYCEGWSVGPDEE